MSEQKAKENRNIYKETLNLPRTDFPMEAKLVANEPPRLKAWQDARLYDQILAARAHSPRGQWILHDGPPFANGDIHIGHLINKTLKDVVIRFRTMQGYQSPYVPGWDCHGLPIEHKIQQELGPKLREMATVDVRKRCYDYAAKYANIQSEQFQRLGILGEWDNPYWTMQPGYEASTLEVFARFVEAGLVYKQLKPVHWSIANQTALADAELEYKDVEDKSIYVEFPVADSAAMKRALDVEAAEDVYYLIWTTTPWTLPANMAISAGPDFDYALVRYTRDGRSRIGVVAAGLVDRVFSKRVESYSVLKTVKGEALAAAKAPYRHPFIERISPVLLGSHVTTEDGTGLVHTAPGHGEEDYVIAMMNGVEVYCPVLHNGRFDPSVPQWLVGRTVWEGNPLVIDKLKELGVLLAEETIIHSYPHDWRSKTPTIFRATEQWFVAIDKPFIGIAEEAQRQSDNDLAGRSLRDRARDAVASRVQFIPDWGKARISGMLESRPDWCISRQRAWGLPIPVFYNEQGQTLLTPQSVRAVARRFGQKGSDAWFTDSPAELLGPDFVYPPGFEAGSLRKEKDIFDVWFESGSSWFAVLVNRPGLKFPADLYLEGSDQHRGWFQLSMLPGLGAAGRPPFQQVLTHGFVVKPDGTKVSKSDKEYVTATQEINKHGADLLRLWCCSVDYQYDIPTSPKVIQDFGDKYRKIRNTLRYLLSNLFDFNPATDAREVPLNSLDGWASAELDTLITDVTAAYDGYQLHRAFRLLYDFCSVTISATYGNAMKDRLYCGTPDSPSRRRCQTVMHRMALAITKLLAPMTVFTADEAWQYIPHRPGDEERMSSVHLALLPAPGGVAVSSEQREEWNILMKLRESALGQLDTLKKDAGLNKALDAELVFEVDSDEMRRKLAAYHADLEDMVGAGFHSFVEAAAVGTPVSVKVVDRRSVYKACARSWKRRPDVGADPRHPELCLRDAQAMASRA